MSEDVQDVATQTRAFLPVARPDLSHLPAYVEPPRTPSGNPHRTRSDAMLALAGVTLSTVGLFGWYLHADHPARPIESLQDAVSISAPEQRVSTALQDVPLPDGVRLQSTVQAHPRERERPVHSALLTRLSNR